MGAWRTFVRAMGGTSVLMQDHMDDLEARVEALQAVSAERERLATRVRWMRAVNRKCQQRRDEMQAEIDALYAARGYKSTFDVEAYLLLDQVLELIDDRACSGDVRHAMQQLWMLLDDPPGAAPPATSEPG
jgi:hypothetical protein